MTVDLQPRLSDGLVTLRPLHAVDWDALYAIARDPLIWEVHPAHDRWQEPVFRAFFEAGLARSGALAIEDATTGALIGSSGFGLERVEPEEVEIGWTFLSRDHWGGTINRSVKRLMLGHALRHFDRAVFLIGEGNLRSRRAMEKIGGHLTDRVYDKEMAGISVRHVIYAIDRAGFAAGPLNQASAA